MAKLKFKKNFRNFLAIALAILVGAGVIFGFVKIGEKLTSKTKEISPSYQIGGIDVSGKGTSATDSIVTKEAFACQGLKITPEFASNIQYQVFFYGVDDMYLECSEVTSETYNYCPTLASHARVVIYPQPDDKGDDVKVKWYQVRSYAKLLTIEVNRKQDFKLEKAITSLDNKFNPWGEGVYNNLGTVGYKSESSGCYFFGDVDVSNVDTLIMKVKESTLSNIITLGNGESFNLPYLYKYGTDNKSVALNFDYTIFYKTDEFVYVSYDVSNETSIFGFVDVNSFATLEIYVL